MQPLPQKFLIGFRIPRHVPSRQLQNAALDLWGTDARQVTLAAATMETYQEFEQMVWIRVDSRRQAATSIYWALSIGAGVRAVNTEDDSNMPLMFFIDDLQTMPALTAISKRPIDIDYLYYNDLMFNPFTVTTASPLASRPSSESIILPPPLDSMLPSRRDPTPDIVVPFFEIGFTLDRKPSDKLIGRAVADLFPLQPTAWQYHIHDMIQARNSAERDECKAAFVWISATDREQVGTAVYWGISLGEGVAVIDSHTATTLPLESFLFEVTLGGRNLTANDLTPITAELLRACDVERIVVANPKAE